VVKGDVIAHGEDADIWFDNATLTGLLLDFKRLSRNEAGVSVRSSPIVMIDYTNIFYVPPRPE
jgi:hypothetical protein